MCRLFGFRSIIKSQVHQSLVSADNALLRQSERNPDGWGVAYFIAGAPHLVKSVSSAIDDHLFRRVSGVVSSETVLAHIRKATTGNLSILNTHPFQYGRWVFAHNGNIKGFEAVRAQIEAKIAPSLAPFVLGETDSELLFYLVLTHISRRVELHGEEVTAQSVVEAVRDAVKDITDVSGPIHSEDNGSPEETYLTFLITNGTTMVGHQGGKHLHYSTFKTKCSARGQCPHFAKTCENPSEDGFVNHLVFSSEPLQGENIWLKMNDGDIVGVDGAMKLCQRSSPRHSQKDQWPNPSSSC
jgi:predicted glutamine amidotransferase